MPSSLAVSLAISVAMATVGPPDLGHLDAALLTAAEMPAGFHLAGGADPVVVDQEYGYSDICGVRRLDATLSGYALHRTLVRNGRSLGMPVGTPGATWAHARVQGITEQPEMCPEFSNPMEESAGLTIRGAGGAPASAKPEDWQTTGLHPIGQPIEVGGVAVGYLVRNRRLYARAMRPETGETLWEREITPSRQTPGMLILPAKVGDNVVVLEPRPESGKNWASLAIIEPVTGRVLQNSRPAIFRSTPYGCFDDEAACAMSVPFKGGVRKEYRLDSMTGAFTPNPVDLPTARNIGDGGLMELGIRPEEPIALVRDGELQWKRPIADAFPAGYSTDNGWNWLHAEKEGVFAGSVQGPARWTADAVEMDLSKGASAGLDESTGAVLWRDDGSKVGCDYSIALKDEPVRCRARGTVRYEHQRQRESFKDVDVILEGFDPATGRTRWSVSAGPATALISFLKPAAVAGARTILTDLPAGTRKINLADGSVTAPAPGEVFWCLAHSRFDFHEGYTSDGFPERFDRSGDNLVTACTADGEPARSGRPSPDATQAIGATANGYSVVATPNGYRGIAVGN